MAVVADKYEGPVLAGVARRGTKFDFGKRGSWRLLWCNERCYKSEHVANRQRMQHILHFRGASLICLKKARNFSSWMERAARPRFALVTDWREAQPCIRAMLAGDRTRPILVVVICDSERQLNRAKAWASRLELGVCAMHICEQGNIPKELLGGLINQCFGNGENIQPAVDLSQTAQPRPVLRFGAIGAASLGNPPTPQDSHPIHAASTPHVGCGVQLACRGAPLCSWNKDDSDGAEQGSDQSWHHPKCHEAEGDSDASTEELEDLPLATDGKGPHTEVCKALWAQSVILEIPPAAEELPMPLWLTPLSL